MGSQRKSGGPVVHAGTEARAAASESAAGVTNRYEIIEMAMFDLFPQTFHIETLVRLRKVE
jgi:tRNA/tmRNA/rRNA uracil-C5-methylase (TrmA/RlmC/RlmD family)